MTNEEFEDILVLKGFTKRLAITHGGVVVKFYRDGLCITPYTRDSILEFEKNYFTLKHKGLTEQKLDEILAQCTKIKTALDMINQIAKGK